MKINANSEITYISDEGNCKITIDQAKNSVEFLRHSSIPINIFIHELFGLVKDLIVVYPLNSSELKQSVEDDTKIDDFIPEPEIVAQLSEEELLLTKTPLEIIEHFRNKQNDKKNNDEVVTGLVTTSGSAYSISKDLIKKARSTKNQMIEPPSIENVNIDHLKDIVKSINQLQKDYTALKTDNNLDQDSRLNAMNGINQQLIPLKREYEDMNLLASRKEVKDLGNRR